MTNTLPWRYRVWCTMGLFEDELLGTHADPKKAIQACREDMYIVAADEDAHERLNLEKARQIKLFTDQADFGGTLLDRRAGKRKRKIIAEIAEANQRIDILRKLEVRLVEALDTEAESAGEAVADAGSIPAVESAAAAETHDVGQTRVQGTAVVDTNDFDAVNAAFRSVGDDFYAELVLGRLRVGRVFIVQPSGRGEEVIHRGGRGDSDYGRIIVKRVNGRPEPASSPAAELFRHFVKVKYRDVRSAVIQQVLGDRPKGEGKSIKMQGEDDASKTAEIAYWLYCAETRKPSIRLKDLNINVRCISVHCPQGSCFHPDALHHIGAILCSHACPGSAMVSGIQMSASCSDEGAEQAAQAIIKLFAEDPSLLVADPWFPLDCPAGC